MSAPFLPRVEAQEMPREYFRRALALQRLAHAYLFVGPRGAGKRFFALELAKALFCQDGSPCGCCVSCRSIDNGNHPGLTEYAAPDGKKSVDIDTVRTLCERSHYARDHAFVALLAGADALTPPAANALLKTLEEPPGRFVLVLTATSVGSILPTLVSRCHRLYFEARSRAAELDDILKTELAGLSEPTFFASDDPRQWLARAVSEGTGTKDRVATLLGLLLTEESRRLARLLEQPGADDRLYAVDAMLRLQEALLALSAGLEGNVSPDLILEQAVALLRRRSPAVLA